MTHADVWKIIGLFALVLFGFCLGLFLEKEIRKDSLITLQRDEKGLPCRTLTVHLDSLEQLPKRIKVIDPKGWSEEGQLVIVPNPAIGSPHVLPDSKD